MQAARGTSLNSGEQPEISQQSPSKARLRAVFITTAAIALLVDIVTKILAVAYLTDKGRVDVVGELFGLHLTRNPGAAFSTGTGFTAFFTVLAIVAAGVVIWLLPRVGTPLWAFGFGMLFAGIVGNLTDRIFRAPGPMHGHVVDFLELPNWPIFNVADMCLNVGVIVILIQTLRGIRLDGSRHQGRT